MVTPRPERDEFTALIDKYRPELLAYCYRMLGSIHDAEDLVQETYLRAWRSYDAFEGRASVRTWLYRIATNACLTALEHKDRRLLPSGLAGPGDTPESPLAPPTPEVFWLQPWPDALVSTVPADPAHVVEKRNSLRLALTAALQFLPARQRAVFIMREVLSMPATEVAELLDTSVAAVKSALQRARAQVDELAPAEDEVAESGEPAVRSLIDRFVEAFDTGNLTALVALLTDDVVAEMPPSPSWYAGRENVMRLFAAHVIGEPGTFSLMRTTANGQHAFGLHKRGDDGVYRAHSIMVLTLAGDLDTDPKIRRMSTFREPSLFAAFGLPEIRRRPDVAPC